VTQQPDNEGLKIDYGLFGAILRRRFRSLLILAVIVFLTGVGGGLFLLPQTFMAEVSLSIQHPTPLGGGLANLIGLGPTQTKYIGIIRSRRLATIVEDKVHLQQLYGLEKRRDAIRLMMNSVQPDENAVDGLLYVRVRLKGPPRLSMDPRGLRPKVKQAVADIANEYAAALKQYYTEVDNDRDAVLLRTVDEQLRDALKQYNTAWANLRQFVSKQPADVPLDEAGIGRSGPGTAMEIINELMSTLARIDADVQATVKSRQALEAKRAELLKHIEQVPSDDAFLKEARENYLSELRNLKNLAVTFAPDHPRVVEARERVKIAKERLEQEQEGVRKGQTSDTARASAELESLTARREVLKQQLEKALGRILTNRSQALEYIRLRKALDVSFDLLKTAITQAISVRSQTASTESRVLVVDSGIPPEYGSPGILMICVLSLFGAIVVPFALISPEYLMRLRLRKGGPTAQSEE
jgi:uncharacterized protein involved in exopolysaccharide biosynthesis